MSHYLSLDLICCEGYNLSMNDFLDEENRILSNPVTNEALGEALSERYLNYALSTIMHRALPDARDGLKPVHRRILFAMRNLKLDASGTYRKCAKIVGEVMGNYHPHGDKAIYDALARLAQDFSVRYPLIDGQGNFGNIDGDNPAAQRYTEARLTKISEFMLDGLMEDSVDFRDNYDGSEREPVVLPSGFPQLLANGSSGIAVGMATNIPPHNLNELCDALMLLIKKPSASVETLVEIIPGPDFPTGGVIVDKFTERVESYQTGRGSFRIRANYKVEELARGSWQIVVTEIPFQVQKAKLLEKLAELITDKKVPGLEDVRDESDEQIRLILEPRVKTVDPEVLMETLFRISDLETKFSLNMNVLVDGSTPKVCSLKETLVAFLEHRKQILLRRSKYKLAVIDSRLEILEGYLVVFVNVERVIEIIRYEDEPKLLLIAEFDLSEQQAEAILNLRLRSLRKLEEIELTKERNNLLIDRSRFEDLIEDDKLQKKEITNQLEELKKAFGDINKKTSTRRTSFGEIPNLGDRKMDVFLEKETLTIVYSAMGWIRAMRGHIALDSKLKFRDGDKSNIIFHAYSTDKILAVGTNGRFYTLSANTLPGGRGMGEPIRIMTELPNDAGIVTLLLLKEDNKILVASNVGNGFIVDHKELEAQTRNGKQILNLKPNEKLSICTPVTGNYVASMGDNGKLLVFPLAELPEMSRGKGVRLQKFKTGGLSDAKVFESSKGLSWKMSGEKWRTETNILEWEGKRASSGRNPPYGFPKSKKF